MTTFATAKKITTAQVNAVEKFAAKAIDATTKTQERKVQLGKRISVEGKRYTIEGLRRTGKNPVFFLQATTKDKTIIEVPVSTIAELVTAKKANKKTKPASTKKPGVKKTGSRRKVPLTLEMQVEELTARVHSLEKFIVEMRSDLLKEAAKEFGKVVGESTAKQKKTKTKTKEKPASSLVSFDHFVLVTEKDPRERPFRKLSGATAFHKAKKESATVYGVTESGKKTKLKVFATKDPVSKKETRSRKWHWATKRTATKFA
tara:strand:+ start:8070 stop:8849 length:780 start_codon:yes stop_codon:yes gene_type:complete